jgi:hypothetical protein
MGKQRETGEEELAPQEAPQQDTSNSEFQGMMQQQASNRQQQINQRVERQGIMDTAYGQPAQARRRRFGIDNPFLGLMSEIVRNQAGQTGFNASEGAWFGAPQQQQAQYDQFGQPVQQQQQMRPEEFYRHRSGM